MWSVVVHAPRVSACLLSYDDASAGFLQEPVVFSLPGDLGASLDTGVEPPGVIHGHRPLMSPSRHLRRRRPVATSVNIVYCLFLSCSSSSFFFSSSSSQQVSSSSSSSSSQATLGEGRLLA